MPGTLICIVPPWTNAVIIGFCWHIISTLMCQFTSLLRGPHEREIDSRNRTSQTSFNDFTSYQQVIRRDRWVTWGFSWFLTETLVQILWQIVERKEVEFDIQSSAELTAVEIINSNIDSTWLLWHVNINYAWRLLNFKYIAQVGDLQLTIYSVSPF